MATGRSSPETASIFVVPPMHLVCEVLEISLSATTRSEIIIPVLAAADEDVLGTIDVESEAVR